MERQGTSSSSSSEQPSDANEPKYTGVRKRKWGKWVSEIRLPNSRERIWLGSYDTPEKAARAFDAALYCLRGRSAKFNFPGNIPDIVGGQSLSPQQIQLVAARYANEEPTTTTTTTSFDPHLLHAPNLEQQQQQQQQHCVASSSDGARPVDGDTTIDWSFYDMLDNIGGDFYKPPSPSTSIEDVREDEAYNSHYPSFLWNF